MRAFCEIRKHTVTLLTGHSGEVCQPSTQEAEVQGPGDGEFRASLGYMVTFSQKTKVVWVFITTVIFIDIELGGVLRYNLFSK